MTERQEATATLEAIAQSRRRLAGRSVSPPMRHIVYAAAIGGWIATPVLQPVYRIASYMVFLAVLIGLVLWDRRRSGMFVNGFRAGGTRWIAVALVVIVVPAYLASTWFARNGQAVWPSLAVALATALIGYGASRLWERRYLDELECAA